MATKTRPASGGTQGSGAGGSFSQGTSGSSTDTMTREREEARRGGNRKRGQRHGD